MNKPRDKAFLVILRPHTQPREFLRESYEEMKELAESALVRVLGFETQSIDRPSPSHYIREGKLEEVRREAKEVGANVLIFNTNLSPGQIRNIEKFAGIPVVDRTGLILDIFGRRAKSAEGKLQVELARLNYMLPRLGGLGVVLSRLGGGVGSSGPGETELETDRRKVRLRIKRVKEELEHVRQHRGLIRAGRKRKNLTAGAIVGYTNAGKSTLLHALTGADAYIEDKMFATLDPKSSLCRLGSGASLLLIDTVGFLRDLPHALVEAFHATLEEVSEADFLIHVLDVADPDAWEHKQSVEEVLKELGAGEKPQLLVLNKADQLNPEMAASIQSRWPEGLLISARERAGLELLLKGLEKFKGESHGEN